MAGGYSLSRPGLALLVLAYATGVYAAAPDAASVKFFEDKVRPVLATRCFSCHGAGKQKGGLRLDSREAALHGGESGPALQPGKADESLLVRAVRQTDELKMPPTGKLTTTEIASLTAWVRMGAPWPETAAVTPLPAAAAPAYTREQKEFWAFRAPIAITPPPVRDASRIRNSIDRFILAELEAKGLRPAKAADRRTIIRRATLDLTGLPPTPEEVNAFLADSSPDAFAHVVDRLLASPAYGERWGRRWLDVARYADSNGMDENLAFAHAWRYRDYVVNAFNQDKPFDRFVREQIAGDLLPAASDAERFEQIAATGLLTVGPKMLAEDDPVKMQMDIVDEQLDTVGQAFLGLTLGCARCHDHKFDPIPTADYYALAGIFKSTKTMDTFTVVASWHERALAADAEVACQKKHDEQTAALKSRLNAFEKSVPAIRTVLGAGGRIAAEKHLRTLRDQLSASEKTRPMVAMAMAVDEGKVEDLRVHVRGSHLILGPLVARRFPTILAGQQQTPLDPKQSGRLQLADWLTRPDHPLTARVFVNRVWLGHFGEGLVRTPDNFGRLGERPVNQPLLDWLAVRFVQDGWSVKKLHRLIMLSATYQMSTAYDPEAARVDPDNRLQWRMNRRRMEAEQLRDSLLAISGRLDRTMGGSLLTVADHSYVSVHANFNRYESPRRSLYLPVIRSDVYNVFQAFDFADPSVPNGRRDTTTVAPQALFMLNGKLAQEESRHLAELLLKRTGEDKDRISAAYERLYARLPTQRDLERALAFLSRYERELEKEKVALAEWRVRAWQGLCRVLLASNEFIFIE
jgi:cytochrome c553/alkylhydroperoxidase/carboxymuconolactone decarboxylase family protein YurZ